MSQDDSRWCRKCGGLFYGGHDTPADSKEHSREGSHNYTLQTIG